MLETTTPLIAIKKNSLSRKALIITGAVVGIVIAGGLAFATVKDDEVELVLLGEESEEEDTN